MPPMGSVPPQVCRPSGSTRPPCSLSVAVSSGAPEARAVRPRGEGSHGFQVGFRAWMRRPTTELAAREMHRCPQTAGAVAKTAGEPPPTTADLVVASTPSARMSARPSLPSLDGASATDFWPFAESLPRLRRGCACAFTSGALPGGAPGEPRIASAEAATLGRWLGCIGIS